MADIAVEVLGEVVAQQGAQRCCQSKVDESNWQLSKTVDAQSPVTPGVTAKYDLAPGQCAPSTIAALWAASVLGIIAGVIVPAAIDGKWGNNLQSLWALGGTVALLGWAASVVTSFEREAEHFVVTYGLGAKVARIPVSAVTAVGYKRAGGCCPWFCFDLSAETRCSENATSVVMSTTHPVKGTSTATSIILDLADPEKFLSDNFGPLQQSSGTAGPVVSEPGAVGGQSHSGNNAVVVPVAVAQQSA